jgi:hypothetical protein
MGYLTRSSVPLGLVTPQLPLLSPWSTRSFCGGDFTPVLITKEVSQAPLSGTIALRHSISVHFSPGLGTEGRHFWWPWSTPCTDVSVHDIDLTHIPFWAGCSVTPHMGKPLYHMCIAGITPTLHLTPVLREQNVVVH